MALQRTSPLCLTKRTTPYANRLLLRKRERNIFMPVRDVVARDGFQTIESFSGLLNLVQPEQAAIISAIVAVGAVCLNLYGGLLTERNKIDLLKEVERERLLVMQQNELRSVIARYRGPLLEAAVDLEQRVYHTVTRTGECGLGYNEDEASYTLFCIAQFMGFLEVVRREGPRERGFLSEGNTQGTDTLTTLVEGFRFVMCSTEQSLENWWAEGETRDHPGARSRRLSKAIRRVQSIRMPSSTAATADASDDLPDEYKDMIFPGDLPAPVQRVPVVAATSISTPPQATPPSIAPLFNSYFEPNSNGIGNGSHNGSGHGAMNGVMNGSKRSNSRADQLPSVALMRMSRGMQRAVGSMMVVTPMGALRHYTMSYGDFHLRVRSDPAFKYWLDGLGQDLQRLQDGPGWKGAPPFPLHRWSRLLLLQQLLVETLELLDPNCVRVAASRRLTVSPVNYKPLPNVDAYKKRLAELYSQMDDHLPITDSMMMNTLPHQQRPGQPSFNIPFYSGNGPMLGVPASPRGNSPAVNVDTIDSGYRV